MTKKSSGSSSRRSSSNSRKKTKRNSKKDIKVLVAHDNRKGSHTTKAHKFAERLDKKKGYKAIQDTKNWKPGEKTSSYETDRREREMVKKSDVVVRIVPASSKKGSRNDGAIREVRKAKAQGKPTIEIYEQGARKSPNQSSYDENYNKKVEVHLQYGQRLETGFKEGLKKLRKKKLIEK